jgi:hypothetical protein
MLIKDRQVIIISSTIMIPVKVVHCGLNSLSSAPSNRRHFNHDTNQPSSFSRFR